MKYLMISIFSLLFIISCGEKDPELTTPQTDNQEVNINLNNQDEDMEAEESEKSEEIPSLRSDSNNEESSDNNEESLKQERLKISNNIALNITINMESFNKENFEIWECKKRAAILTYFLNNQPTTVDDNGTSNPKPRVCELFQINDKKTTLFYYAHNEKDFCKKKLDEILQISQSSAKRRGGFECSKKEVDFLAE